MERNERRSELPTHGAVGQHNLLGSEKSRKYAQLLHTSICLVCSVWTFLWFCTVLKAENAMLYRTATVNATMRQKSDRDHPYRRKVTCQSLACPIQEG